MNAATRTLMEGLARHFRPEARRLLMAMRGDLECRQCGELGQICPDCGTCARCCPCAEE